MRILTVTLTSDFAITRDMQVLQWSVTAASSDADFAILGNAVVNESGTSTPITNAAVPCGSAVGTGTYNSAQASTFQPWDGVTIQVNAGSVTLILTQE